MADQKMTKKRASNAKRRPAKKKSLATSERRGTYTNEQKQLVMERYQYCITRQEKLELAHELGMETLEQLYNLANRLGATRPQHGVTEEDREAHAAFHPERRKKRELIAETVFTPDDNAYLEARFGKMRIEEIAYHRGHTETAMMYQARHLGLRHYCKYWTLENVLDWFHSDLDDLLEIGMDVYACKDRHGDIAINIVSTSSLLRLIDNPLHLATLRRDGADEFFLQELLELLEDHRQDRVTWEVSRWISHGHICLNPWARESFLLFDNGTDHKMPAREVYPGDLV